MWIGVTKRFTDFVSELDLTGNQVADGTTKHRGVRKCLNQHYYDTDSETANSFLIGSWGKGTRVRPPRDIDIDFVLPPHVYDRITKVSGNRQSILLQEVKAVLEDTYPSTTMRGDGQVVVVAFSTFSVEVAPVFLLNSGQYYFCNTNDGGSFEVADPVAERSRLNEINEANNYNAKKLIRMMKAWQSWCSVPLKSVQIELLVSEYIQQSEWRLKSAFYHDWLCRDFFAYALGRTNSYVFLPGTAKMIALGDEWKSRCESALGRARKACDLEYEDYTALAGQEWQKIFGPQIPVLV
jgi:hypothetical protein